LSRILYPCTANDPLGRGWGSGLLGHGELPWPETVAARSFPPLLDIGGRYNASDRDAAEFLILQLGAVESELEVEEAQDYALMLRALLDKMASSTKLATDELVALQKRAEAISGLGPVLFSPGNMPGTLAALGGIVHAASMSTKVENLLDLDRDTRKALKKWATSRGKPGSVSANRAFRGRIKLVRYGGNLFFEIPANAKASLYRVNGQLNSATIRLSAHDTARALRSVAHVDSAAYGSRGVGRVLTGSAAGPLLSFGPQMVIDASNSSSISEFLHRSAYSQPSNVAAFAAGAVLVGLAGTAIVVVSIALVTGAAVHILLSEELTGWGNDIGDWLTRSN